MRIRREAYEAVESRYKELAFVDVHSDCDCTGLFYNIIERDENEVQRYGDRAPRRSKEDDYAFCKRVRNVLNGVSEPIEIIPNTHTWHDYVEGNFAEDYGITGDCEVEPT
jgi:hypothetical protein